MGHVRLGRTFNTHLSYIPQIWIKILKNQEIKLQFLKRAKLNFLLHLIPWKFEYTESHEAPPYERFTK